MEANMFRVAMKSLLLVAVCVALAFALAQGADAASWTYSEIGGFDFGTATTGFIAGNTPCCGGIDFFNPVSAIGIHTQYQTIAWGCQNNGLGGDTTLANCAAQVGKSSTLPNVNATTVSDPTLNINRSALKLTTFGGSISDDGVFVPITMLTHFNRAIDGNSRTLGTVDITALLSLTAPNPGPPFPNENTITLGFLETANAANAASCGQTANPLGTACDDQFSVLSLGGFLSIPFSSGGLNYVMDFTLAAPCNNVVDQVGTITVFLCSGVELGIDFVNLQVYAGETNTSNILVLARILPVPVPEPASVGLLGLGLVAVGVASRIRSRKGR
jgi:PEP-CTERM motif-containing protein